MIALDPLNLPLDGSALIEASAGTGKTHTITTLYIRLLLERGLQPSQILVVTYTNAAAAELRARVRRRVHDALAALEGNDGSGDDETLGALLRRRRAGGSVDADRRTLAAALCVFDEAAIFTIHGFCQRMLQEHAFESGVPFDTQLVTDQAPLRDEVVRDFWAREIYEAPAAFIRYLQQKKVTPATLTRLAQMAVAHPAMPVLPEHVDAIDAPMDAWRAAHLQVAALWQQERDAIVQLLLESDALNRAKYPARAIREVWAPDLDAAMAAGMATRCATFEKFTAHAVEQATKKRHLAPAHPFFTACESLSRCDTALQHAWANRLLRLQLDLVRYARREVPQRNRHANTQSFDDLLQRLDAALAGPGGAALAARIRGRFHAALIDEFQDTDPIQYDVFRRVYHATGATLFLIGDPKQAIYAFRGADVFTYMAARRDAAGKAYTLAINRRSGPRLVEAVNTLFQQARLPFVFDAIDFHPVRAAPRASEALGGTAAGQAALQILIARPRAGEPTINKTAGTAQVTDAVAAAIVRLLSGSATITAGGDTRAIQPGDIAVLCRTNAQASGMQTALRRQQVPSVLRGDASVFDTPDAAELERVLYALADPRDAGRVRAALATTLLGLSGNDLCDLQTNEPEWDAWLRRFDAWHDDWERCGFVPAFRRLLDERGVQRRLLSFTDGERRMTNLLHLGELLQTALGEAQRGPLALVEWLTLMRRDTTARADLGAEAAQIRLESDDRAVQLVTIHKSKGLEYPIVFCPYLWDGTLLHDEDKQLIRFHADDQLMLDIGSAARAAHLARATEEALAENLRLVYVALTRAKHRCSIVWGPFNDAETSALGYLLHQPQQVAPGADLAAIVGARIKRLDAAAMRADLDRLVAAAHGTIAVADLDETPVEPFTQSGERRETLQCRIPSRLLHPGWRISSFSGLAARDAVGGAADAGVDHDEVTEEDAGAALALPAGDQAQIVLHAFPPGVRSGVLMHEVFQHLDFQQTDPGILRTSLRATLQRNGFGTEWTDVLCRAVADVVTTPLDAQLCLRDIPASRRLSELEFIFPVANAATEGALTGARLADVFSRYGTAPLPADYAERVRRLGFTPLAGYLRGFIDLAFEHAGRWYVVDYKSNLLGLRPADYRPSRVVEAMARHHYFLQYHLYAVALHRHLAARLADYDYDRHFGGVYYLFLRGMSPQYAAGCGVFRDRPQPALVEGLSAVLAQPRSGGRQ